MSKSVYFVSNNKVPNLKFFLKDYNVPTYATRKEARIALKCIKSTKTLKTSKYYRIFKVSAVSVR